MSSRWSLICVVCLCASCKDATIEVGKFATSQAGHGSVADASTRAHETPSSHQGEADGGPPPEDAAAADPGATDTTAATATDTSQPVSANPPDVVSADATPNDQFCAGRGLGIRAARPPATADCGTRLARKWFSNAICSCDGVNLNTSSALIDSFDSRRGAYQTSETGAAVGVNGAFTSSPSDIQILGSLVVAGDQAMQIGGSNFIIAGDFKTNAGLEIRAPGARVVRDLWVGGDVKGPAASVSVGRDAYQATGRLGSDVIEVAGSRRAPQSIAVQAPCACAEESLLDVAGLVAQALTTNDNSLLGWSPSALQMGALTTDKIELPCGRLFVDQIAVGALSTHWITYGSRTMVFVIGNLTVEAIATLFVAPAGDRGELDLFVAGDLVVNGTLQLGDPLRPAATRVYVGGGIRQTGSLLVAAGLYAPRAQVRVTPVNGTTEAYGSIFARSIEQTDTFRMHYDRAIRDMDAECTAPAPQRCDGCNQCPGQLACVMGRCDACARDSDCCSPSVCSNGSCNLLQSVWP